IVSTLPVRLFRCLHRASATSWITLRVANPIKSLRPNSGCHSAPSKRIGPEFFKKCRCVTQSNWPTACWRSAASAKPGRRSVALQRRCAGDLVYAIYIGLPRKAVLKPGLYVVDHVNAQDIVIDEGKVGHAG